MEEELARIESYLAGKMSEQDVQLFERELDENPNLKRLLEEELLLQIALKQQAEQELRQAFNQRYQKLKTKNALPDIPEEFAQKDQTSQKRSMPRWLILGALGLAAALAIFFLLRGLDTPTSSPEELFATNYEKPDFLEVKSAEGDSLWQVVLAALRREEYEEARRLIQEVLQDSSFDRSSEAWLYLGHLEMESKNYKAAVEAYKKVDIQVQTAEWHQMLAYLALNDREAVKKLLPRLSQYKFYQKRAKNIQKSLGL